MPFLTDLDSRAKVKGSRDPLGLVPIWSRFGRKVVGNLTTVTSGVRGFTTLLLGLYLADRVQERGGANGSAHLDTFLRFEQLAGYSRVKFGPRNISIRGWQRINARLADSKRIRVSARTEDQILSNQKVYGLWGLFTMAARASGLLAPGQQQLVPETERFVERQYTAILGRSVVDLLRRDSFDFEPEGKHAELARAIAKAHTARLSDAEKAFYREHLAWGGPGEKTGGAQQALSESLASLEVAEFGYPEFRALRRRIGRQRDRVDLAASLAGIDALEQLLNPARIAFGFLLTQDAQTVGAVVRKIAGVWNRPPNIDAESLPTLRAEIEAASWADAAARWIDFGQAITGKDYRRAVELLVAMNCDVMQKRNGSAAWISIESGKLRVRIAEEQENLMPPQEVENLWRSTYFISSLWNVSREVA